MLPFIGDRRDGDVYTRLITNTISGRGNLNYADYTSHDAVNDPLRQRGDCLWKSMFSCAGLVCLACQCHQCALASSRQTIPGRENMHYITIIAAIIVNIATISELLSRLAAAVVAALKYDSSRSINHPPVTPTDTTSRRMLTRCSPLLARHSGTVTCRLRASIWESPCEQAVRPPAPALNANPN